MYISYVTESAPTDLIICNIEHRQKLCEKFQNLFYKTFKTCRKETYHGEENFEECFDKSVEFSVHSALGSAHIMVAHLPNTA
jgi:hypothetical protein